MNKTWVLYHAPCNDGFGAAWASKRALHNRCVNYVPMNYHSPMPDSISCGDVIYMLDYCRNDPEELKELSDKCPIIILDHHKSAKEICKSIKDISTVDLFFDMDKSGSILSWEYFNNDRPAPEFLKDIEDRDLWRFERDNTKFVYSGLLSYPFDFDVWSTFETRTGYNSLVELGKQLVKYEKSLITMMCKEALLINIGGYDVPCANATSLFSDVAHNLLCDYTGATFSAYRRYLSDGMVSFGLRGRGDFDVSKVAELYGGGGHHDSAGFVLKEGQELANQLLIKI